jgi:adenylate cyclase
MPDGERRLAAIMFTDIAGYTSLTEANEALSMKLLEEHRAVVRPSFSRHGGREVKTIGDAFLVEFGSALEAVRCAFEIQQALHERNVGRPEGERVTVRVGVHLGDVIHSQDDVYGEAVNVASRVEPLAEPGGICISGQVYDDIKNKFEFPLSSLGRRELKNVREPTEVYAVVLPWEAPESAPSQGEHRIAVLPFANFSPDPNDEYFADGITEEIISTVSGISGFSVISRTSVMGYKKTTKKVREIGRELEVRSVLEGSLRKAGNRIRITTQLIDVEGDRHLWAQNYDRELTDVFEVQSDIAKQVADALKVKILPQEEAKVEKAPTRSPEAHELYLKGRYYWTQRNKEALLKAIGLYEAAIELDGSYALANSGIADCYSIMADHGYRPREEATAKAMDYARKAVALDDTCAEAHASLANALFNAARDFAGADKEFKRALDLNQSYATAHHWRGVALSYSGRPKGALKEALKAEKLDPLSPQIATFLGITHEELGRYEDAERQFQRALDLSPKFVPAVSNLAVLRWKQKRYGDARNLIAEFFELTKNGYGRTLSLAVTDALEGKGAEARKALAEADGFPHYPYQHESLRILCHLALGELDTAVAMLEGEYARGATWLGGMRSDPLYAPMVSDPRVQSLLGKAGVAMDEEEGPLPE